MPVLTSLLILIVSARILGQVFTRMKQPAIVGEMLAGVLLGPACLGLVHATPALSGISELAVFFVIFSAGLEMKLSDVMEVFKGRALTAALIGFAIPFAGGLGLGLVWNLDVMRTVFLAICVSITALPVAVRMLESFGILNTQLARLTIGTAVVNDVLALLALGVILGLPSYATAQGVAQSVALVGGKLLLLLGFIWGANRIVRRLQFKGLTLSRFPEWLAEKFGQEAVFGVIVAFVLLFGSVSDALGFHFVIGAFFGALMIDKDFFLAPRYEDLEKNISSVSGGLLSPVFFAYLGLEFNLGAVQSVWFVLAVLAVSIFTKVAAGWIGGKVMGLSHTESMGLGAMLNGRGVMELVIASIALQRGFIGQNLFTTLVIMGVVTTLITPLLFRQIYGARLKELKETPVVSNVLDSKEKVS